MTTRFQITITISEQLQEAIRFAAMRDGLAPSTKARQILTQQLTRTMESPAFLEHAGRIGLSNNPDEKLPVDDNAE